MASVIVTGASGLLGRAIYQAFKASDAGFKVIGLCHSRVKEGLVQCDLTDKDAVAKLFSTYKPQIVIHSAAERKPDVVEKDAERTKSLNVGATQYLVDETVRRADQCYLLYISTDYVFDGKCPPYRVDAEPNPINKYGVSKLEGENTVLACNKKHSTGHGILRVPILYGGDIESVGESAVTVLLDLLQPPAGREREVRVVDHYQRRYPTHVRDVAAVCTQLAQLYVKNGPDVREETSGIFHWSSTEQSMTKYDMVSEMAQIFNLSMDNIKPDCGPPKPATTPRPYDVKLDISRLKTLGLGTQTSFTDGIKSCLEPFVTKVV